MAFELLPQPPLGVLRLGFGSQIMDVNGSTVGHATTRDPAAMNGPSGVTQWNRAEGRG